MSVKFTNDVKIQIMTKALNKFGLEPDIREIAKMKEACTFAEKIVIQNKTVSDSRKIPIKNSYMLYEGLIICFFFNGDVPAFSFSGLVTLNSTDLKEHELYKAFEIAEKVIAYMQELTDAYLSLNELEEYISEGKGGENDTC